MVCTASSRTTGSHVQADVGRRGASRNRRASAAWVALSFGVDSRPDLEVVAGRCRTVVVAVHRQSAGRAAVLNRRRGRTDTGAVIGRGS